MYCKYCSQKLSDNSVNKCPSCGARIDFLDYGQSFYEDHELEAWKDNSPISVSQPTQMVTNEKTVGVTKAVNAPLKSAPGSVGRKDPKAADGAVGFFSRHKVAIIASSIASVLVIVLSVVLIVALNKDPVIIVEPESSKKEEQIVPPKDVESLIFELIIHYYDMNNRRPEIGVSKNDAGEYLYKFNLLGKDYKIKIVADGVDFSFAHGDDAFENYTIKGGEFVLIDQAYIRGETESFKQFFCEKIVGKPYKPDNTISTPESPVTESPENEPQDNETTDKSTDKSTPDIETTPNSGTTPDSQQGELISLKKFLQNEEGFSTIDNVTFWKYEDETVGSAYSVTFGDENNFSYRYDKSTTKKGRTLYADYPEGYKRIDGEVHVTKKDANIVLNIIMSAKNK